MTDIEAARSWRDGQVWFDNTPLAEAVEELNRYSETKLRINDPRLGAEPISGSFPAGKPAAFAESLAMYLPVEASQRDGVIVLTPAVTSAEE